MRTILLLVMLAAPTVAAGQGPSGDPDVQRERMAELAFMVGEWEGEGWTRRGPGDPERFRGTETVTSYLDGLVYVIEGEFQDLETGETAHHALAIVSWDEAAGHYAFRAFLRNGLATDATGAIENGAFVWSPPAPPGMEIRYTLRTNDEGHWHEIGEMSRDGGATWNPFFEMELVKKAD